MYTMQIDQSISIEEAGIERRRDKGVVMKVHEYRDEKMETD